MELLKWINWNKEQHVYSYMQVPTVCSFALTFSFFDLKIQANTYA